MGIPINPVSPRVQYVATAGQTVFNVPFPFFTNADLAVYYTVLGNVANDAADILVYSTDYTVTGAGSASGGTIILNSGAINTGDVVTIVREMLEQRLSLYLPGGLFTADQVNNDFSMDVMMSQQNQMQTQILTPHYQYSAPVSSVDIELPQLGANDVWQMNSSGTAIIATPMTGGGGGAGGNVGTVLPTTLNALTKWGNTAGTLVSTGVLEPSAGNLTQVVSINGSLWPPAGDVWATASVNTSMVANTNYITISPGGTLQMTLPATIVVGTILRLVGFNATGWILKQLAGQTVYFGNQSTTPGTGGSIASTNAKDCIELLCVVANTTFVVLSGVGNLTVV